MCIYIYRERERKRERAINNVKKYTFTAIQIKYEISYDISGSYLGVKQ